MSRIEYDEGYDDYDSLRGYAWAWNTEQSLRGQKGQAFLREMEAALLAMPKKELIAGEFVSVEGDCCPLGALEVHRRIARGASPEQAVAESREDFPKLEYECGCDELTDAAVKIMRINRFVAFAVMEKADEICRGCSRAGRYESVLAWVHTNLKEE